MFDELQREEKEKEMEGEDWKGAGGKWRQVIMYCTYIMYGSGDFCGLLYFSNY